MELSKTITTGTAISDVIYYKNTLSNFDATVSAESNATLLSAYTLNLMKSGEELYVSSDTSNCPIVDSKIEDT